VARIPFSAVSSITEVMPGSQGGSLMISDSVIKELRSILGMDWVLDTPEDIATYSYDAFLPG
jgi:hypothetical protein